MSWFAKLFRSRPKFDGAERWVSGAESSIRNYAAEVMESDLPKAFSNLKAAHRIFDNDIHEGEQCPLSTLNRLAEHLKQAVDGAPHNAVVFHEAFNILSLVRQYLSRQQSHLATNIVKEIGQRWPEMLESFLGYEAAVMNLRKATEEGLAGRTPRPDMQPILIALQSCPSNPNAWWALGTALGLNHQPTEVVNTCFAFEKRLNEVFRKDLLAS